MSKNYVDFLDAMHAAHRDGHTVDKLVLSSSSMNTFFTDDNFTSTSEQKQNQLGEFEVPITEGDGDYLLTESGNRVAL